ncbi:hypothetical protein GE061_014575 [Apolygus lucorum]|uniref:Uncharacterized protein n=1 Tax=Apolygus lucorum TaxID=248454 RepID=A0A6A4J879_APOLU|nr:hypothetical protein GE061_014575 [Apolygus lucorum]
MEIMEAPSFEGGDLVIDMTLSDEEDLTSQPAQAVNPLEPKISLEVPEVDADVPTELASSSALQDPLRIQNSNPNSVNVKPTDPGALAQKQDPAAVKDPNLLGILGDYTPSELARVTTQAMIECIARFPALWDSQEPNYHNFKYCSLLWKNIAVVLTMNVKKAKSKWYSLKSAYRKEYMRSTATGIPSRFTYYQALSFLEPEILREKERADIEQSKLNDIIKRSKAIPNGTASVDEDDDDDCVIVENLEDCSESATPNAADSLVVPSTSTSLISEVKNETDGTRLDQIVSVHSVNGSDSDNKQSRPLLIRAKNISELMAVPAVSVEPPITISKRARSPSPEVVFLSQKPLTIPRIVVSDAFPPLKPDDKEPNDQSSCNLTKKSLENEMRSSVQKKLSPKTSKNSKNKKHKKQEQQQPNGSSTSSDSTALRFLKEPQALSKSVSELAKPGNELSDQSKNLNGTILGKRVNGFAPSSSKLTKKRRSSHSDSTKGTVRTRDPLECTEMNKGFLTSLLPDVEGMTNAQFRTFKKQATALVSMILDR